MDKNKFYKFKQIRKDGIINYKISPGKNKLMALLNLIKMNRIAKIEVIDYQDSKQ